VTPIYKKGKKENPGNYRPVSLISVPGKVMVQFILNALTRHTQDNQGIRPSQHGFMKGRFCLTNLFSFYDQVTCLVDERKAVDVVCLDFRKAFDTVPHSTLLEELDAHGLDGCHWIKKWLNGRAQRLVVNGVNPLGGCCGLAWISARCPPKQLYPSPSSSGQGRGNMMNARGLRQGQGEITHQLLSRTKQTELGEKRVFNLSQIKSE